LPVRDARSKTRRARRRAGPPRYRRRQSRSPGNDRRSGLRAEHAFVVKDASEVAALPRLKNPLVVSQTTIKLQTFLDAAEAVKLKTDDEVQIVNTICSATRDRQDAARALAGEVDAFYIIGGRHSSNSRKLLTVCKEQCEKSFLIETEEEINPQDLIGARNGRRDGWRFDAELAD
jgi:4-hydroxy-3-methylbut-2-enyl diphosphate reductase IspH